MATRVTGFDPGETTGVVVLEGRRVLSSHQVGFEDILAVLSGRQAAADLWRWWSPVWAVEDFRVYPYNRLVMNQLNVVRVIGALLVTAKRLAITTELQMARPVKAAIGAKQLQELQGYELLHTAHEKDAARHALYYLKREEKLSGAS